jgi:hypothetical protein
VRNRIRICIKGTGRIRIRIKVKSRIQTWTWQICNTAQKHLILNASPSNAFIFYWAHFPNALMFIPCILL